MYGIPTMKLSKKVVQRRLDLMAEEGIVFKTGINIGQDVSAQEIKDEHDAMLLCMGATWPRDLPIEGRNSAGGKDQYLRSIRCHLNCGSLRSLRVSTCVFMAKRFFRI